MPDAWVSQMRKGFVELAILAAVRSGDDYGYAIMKRLRAIDALAVTESTLYPALSRMTEDGLLTAWRVASSDGPPRRYFALSQKGRDRLADMAAHWAALRSGVDLLLAPSLTEDDPR